MEHLEHFGLAQEPFSNDPILRFFFPSRLHSDAERRLLRGVRQGKGLSLLIGDSGAGKTMLARHLLEGLDEDLFEPALLVMVQRGPDAGWLLARIARQFGVEEPAADETALLGQLYAELVAVREAGRQPVVLIDDAQLLTPGATLEGLRGLLSLEHDERRLVSLVLIGSPELEDALAGDPMLSQRVDIRVQLDRLDADGTAAYLAHRLRTAGGDPGMLDAGSVAALHRIASGVPRVINTLADNALYEAFLAGRTGVEKDDIERAAADLGLAGAAHAAAAERAVAGGAEPRTGGEGPRTGGDDFVLDPDLPADSRAFRRAAVEVDAEAADPGAAPLRDIGLRGSAVRVADRELAGAPLTLDDGIPPPSSDLADPAPPDADFAVGLDDSAGPGRSGPRIAITEVLEETARDFEFEDESGDDTDDGFASPFVDDENVLPDEDALLGDAAAAAEPPLELDTRERRWNAPEPAPADGAPELDGPVEPERLLRAAEPPEDEELDHLFAELIEED